MLHDHLANVLNHSPTVGSEEEKNWRRRNPQGYKLSKPTTTHGSTTVHRAAQLGNADGLRRSLEENPDLVNAKDINGWTPLLVGLLLLAAVPVQWMHKMLLIFHCCVMHPTGGGSIRETRERRDTNIQGCRCEC